jgi:predicted acyltransferase
MGAAMTTIGTQPAPRDFSLDAYRGLTILLMVIVNVQGSPDNGYALLSHAEWNGLTLADLVFPWFLFIAGLSAPLALNRLQKAPDANSPPPSKWPKILRRAAMLFFIGMALSWLIRPSLDPSMIRWTGVLQRIAFVYVACVAVLFARPGYVLAAILCGAALVFHSLIILYVPAPGEAAVSLLPGEGISAWLDRLLVPGRILRKTWDPEGVLSTLPSIGSGLLGLATMRWVQVQTKPIEIPLLGFAFALTAGGLLLGMILPVNKSLWTASFVLVTAGQGLGLWMLIRIFWPQIGDNRVTKWIVSLGQAALTLYVVHTLLLAVIVRKLPSGEKLWTVLFDALASTGLSVPFASLVFALIATAISAAFIPPLRRRGWLIRA